LADTIGEADNLFLIDHVPDAIGLAGDRIEEEMVPTSKAAQVESKSVGRQSTSLAFR
jgi:hypothetical protein